MTMELMIKHSEILTIMIQAFFITAAGFIFVGCGSEFLEDISRSRKILKKGEKKKLREYTCPKCGYSAWALDHIMSCKCFKCKTEVQTKPVATSEEKSCVCNEKKLKRV